MFRRAFVHHNQLPAKGKLTCCAIFSILTALSGSAACALAQTAAAQPLLATTSEKSAPLKIPLKPVWQDLTASQQVSLQPLAQKWNTLSETQKRKWIAIAVNYPKLTVADQTKLHKHMAEWVSLSQQQRSQARLNFAQSKQLSPTQKAANWDAYQALDPEEKKKLAISALPRTLGAATAAKPVPAQKLALVPVTRQTPKEGSKIAAANHVVNRNTLLPHPASSTEASPPLKN